jgi:hypothetical protein
MPGSAQQTSTSPVLRISDDLGATWTEHAIPDPDKTQGVVRLLAVEPGEPMKLVVALEVSSGATDQPDPIFVSTDSGASFKPYSSEILAAGPALRLANGQLLLGDSGSPGGLWLADGIGMPLRKIADYSIKCLAQQPKGGKVFMCKPYEIGLLDVAKAEFCGIFQLNETESLVSCPSADLTTNMSVQSQLCGAWCGPAHYAFTPMCAIYNKPNVVCGIQARAWDTMDPNPERHWIEPPGSLAAPRCAGFERVVPAGDAGVSDAGTSQSDAGTTHEDDAGAPADDAGHASTRADSGSSAEPKSDDGGGCSVAVRTRAQHSLAWLGLALFSLLAWRRRRAGSARA